MSKLQALLLGLIQGITEFLPVSSSGHLEIGHAILGIKNENDLLFVLVVHVATVLSTIIVFRKDIAELCSGLLKFQWNDETKFISKLLVSSIPIVIVGLLFSEKVESFFVGNLHFVGSMLLITALLLSFTHFVKTREGKITFPKALVIGIAQMFAILPGISRSGATIATGILLGSDKTKVARFSFLMVLIPIIGAVFVDVMKGDISTQNANILPLSIGFVSAFISGLLACSWMIKIVKRGKLIYFAIYCALIGLIAIFAA
jgi:undecaprenyl-diphosphatase